MIKENMNTKKIDILNIGLLLISLVIAISLPFKLFLLAYAILGPLHYLTEINWLSNKDYFIGTKKNWISILIIFTIIISLFPILDFLNFGINDSKNGFLKTLGRQGKVFLLIGFLFAIGLIFFKKTKHIIMVLIIAFIIAFFSNNYLPEFLLFVAIFLPTIIHVFLFTLFFILFGAIKSKSKYGLLLGLLLIAVPFVISFIPINPVNYKLSKTTVDAFITTNMLAVSSKIFEILNNFQEQKFFALSIIGIKIQIFISFAYIYHYLNWFSKTSIIGWQKAINKKNLYKILIVWALSVGLYFYDFKTGLIVLYGISMLHVLLEFPLNILSIKELFLYATSKVTKKLSST